MWYLGGMDWKTVPPALGFAASGCFAWGIQVIWPSAPQWMGYAALGLAAATGIAALLLAARPEDDDKFVGLDDLVHYLQSEALWGQSKDTSSPHFPALIEEAIKEAVGVRGLAASGRPYSAREGGLRARNAPRHISVETWDSAQFCAYGILLGQPVIVGGVPASHVLRIDDGVGWHEVKFFRPTVEDIWRRPRTGFARIIYGK
jgi:hypothetical protein